MVLGHIPIIRAIVSVVFALVVVNIVRGIAALGPPLHTAMVEAEMPPKSMSDDPVTTTTLSFLNSSRFTPES
jgi:hypothetical protein